MRTFLAVPLLALFIALPAQAHDIDDLNEWRADWITHVLADGLTVEAVTEWQGMAEAHGCDWPGTECIILPTEARDSTYRGVGGNVEQWRGLVELYFQPADVPWALRVMACESGGNPSAKNPNSSASGLMQHLASYWPERSAKAGWAGADIFNPEANIAVAAWLYYNSGAQNWVCR